MRATLWAIDNVTSRLVADSTMDTRDWDDEDEARELLLQSLLALIHPVFVDVEGHCTGDGIGIERV